jgi:hypothetical protein
LEVPDSSMSADLYDTSTDYSPTIDSTASAHSFRSKHHIRFQSMDPDADYSICEDEDAAKLRDTENASSCDEDSIWGNTDDFVPYSLEDDEADLQAVRKPIYLRECLELLRTPDTDEHSHLKYEIAMQEATNLVRSHPIDLPDIAISLASQVLRMENYSNLDDFSKNQLSTLIAILVEEPITVGNFLIGEFYNDGSLVNRLTILSSLCEAAHELCGGKELKMSFGRM